MWPNIEEIGTTEFTQPYNHKQMYVQCTMITTYYSPIMCVLVTTGLGYVINLIEDYKITNITCNMIKCYHCLTSLKARVCHNRMQQLLFYIAISFKVLHIIIYQIYVAS